MKRILNLSYHIQDDGKEGKFLLIKAKLDGERYISSSGKTLVVASTHGFIRMNENISFSLNVVEPNESGTSVMESSSQREKKGKNQP